MNFFKLRCTAGVAFAAFGLLAPAHAEVTLPKVISSHMVLQRDMAVPIWGRADAGEKVKVTFRGQSKEAMADEAGRWKIHLDPVSAGGPDTLTVAGSNTITLEDILVGEVWVGSGQSNMAGSVGFYLPRHEGLRKIVQEAPFPEIRIFKNGFQKWSVAGGAELDEFSAHLFSFGHRLQGELNIPIGLLQAAESGTPSRHWIDKDTLASDEASQKMLANYDRNAAQAMYDADVAEWNIAATSAREAGKPEPRKPFPPLEPGIEIKEGKVGHGYEAYVRPLIPYGIRGVLWDQGEAFTGITGLDQFTLMSALIRDWRKEWGQGNFPFLYLQKPSGSGCAWDPNDPITAPTAKFERLPKKVPDESRTRVNGLFREQFIKIMRNPETVMVTASDLEFDSGGHPSNKYGYGTRSARVALGYVYGKPVEILGPLYKSHQIEGDKVRVSFTHTGKGLVAKHADKLQGFAVAGEDRKFFWADAEIEGDKVIVSSPDVPHPVAVRYAWSKYIKWANLFNQDGLPALTFRTDDWPQGMSSIGGPIGN